MNEDQVVLGPLWRDQRAQPDQGDRGAGQHPGPPAGNGNGNGNGSRRRRQALVAAGVAVVAAAATAVALTLPGSAPARPAAASQGTASHHSASRHVSQHTTGAQAAAAGTLLAAGQQGTRAQVPWSQVGAGWMLAAWNPDKPTGAKNELGYPEEAPTPTTLFLVDPQGGRYSMDTLPVQPAGSSQPQYLAAWSGDGQRALLDAASSPEVSVVNLRTGAMSEFSLGTGVSPRGFTSPDGLAILANATGANPDRPELERFSLTGQLEHAYPSTFTGGRYYDGIGAVDSPDGTQVAVSTSGPGDTSGPMELMTNDGQVIRSLPVSASATGCSPLRWWNPADLLARCTPVSHGNSQLWLVPASGAQASPLTAATPAQGDLGDLDAWALPSGTYVQDAGGCGYVYVARLQPSAQTAPVPVPGVPSGDSAVVLGAYGNDLAIQANGACGGLSRVMWFNPAAGTVTPLLGPGANGGYTDGVELFGDNDLS